MHVCDDCDAEYNLTLRSEILVILGIWIEIYIILTGSLLGFVQLFACTIYLNLHYKKI